MPEQLPGAIRDLLIRVRAGLKERPSNKQRVTVDVGWPEVRAIYEMHMRSRREGSQAKIAKKQARAATTKLTGIEKDAQHFDLINNRRVIGVLVDVYYILTGEETSPLAIQHTIEALEEIIAVKGVKQSRTTKRRRR